jgi:hypothetical protein
LVWYGHDGRICPWDGAARPFSTPSAKIFFENLLTQRGPSHTSIGLRARRDHERRGRVDPVVADSWLKRTMRRRPHTTSCELFGLCQVGVRAARIERAVVDGLRDGYRESLAGICSVAEFVA